MTVLSDRDILAAVRSGELVIEPFAPEAVQPASYDLALGESFSKVDGVAWVNDQVALWPGDFLLACTAEWVELSNTLAAALHGRSSLGRKGLAVHITAGWIDPGFRGQITLELANVSRERLVLRAGQRVAQPHVPPAAKRVRAVLRRAVSGPKGRGGESVGRILMPTAPRTKSRYVVHHSGLPSREPRPRYSVLDRATGERVAGPFWRISKADEAALKLSIKAREEASGS